MIRFELNNPGTFALTNDQFHRIFFLIEGHGSGLDYDIVEGDNPARPHVKVWVHHENTNPTRYWVDVDGTIGVVEEVTWDWKGEGATDGQA